MRWLEVGCPPPPPPLHARLLGGAAACAAWHWQLSAGSGVGAAVDTGSGRIARQVVPASTRVPCWPSNPLPGRYYTGALFDFFKVRRSPAPGLAVGAAPSPAPSPVPAAYVPGAVHSMANCAATRRPLALEPRSRAFPSPPPPPGQVGAVAVAAYSFNVNSAAFLAGGRGGRPGEGPPSPACLPAAAVWRGRFPPPTHPPTHAHAPIYPPTTPSLLSVVSIVSPSSPSLPPPHTHTHTLQPCKTWRAHGAPRA